MRKEEIERVYTQYFRDVFLYLRSLSADAGTAEEIAQETFMKALKSLDSFDGSRDILPLYLDDVVSDDTKEMVEEHLQSCESCREEAVSMKKDIILPASKSQRFAEARVIRKIRNKIFRKKVIIAVVTAAAVFAVGMGGYAMLVLPKSVIPYEEGLVEVSRVTLGDTESEYLYCNIAVSEAAGTVCHNPVTVQTEEGEKTVVIIYAYSTTWSRYVAPHIGNGDSDGITLESLGNADEVDEVYYGEFEPVSEFYENPEAVLDNAELIWSAEE